MVVGNSNKWYMHAKIINSAAAVHSSNMKIAEEIKLQQDS